MIRKNPLNIDTSVDGHVHTKLCRHAKGEMEEYVQAAINKGLRKIIFLEHLEMRVNYFETTWLTEKDFTIYFNEGERLKKKYNGKIEIGLGVEVGYNHNSRDEILLFLNKYNWDRIGISCHFLKVNNIVANLLSKKKQNIEAVDKIGMTEVVERYFKKLKQAVQFLPGTVLCHMDAALRYHPEVDDFSRWSDLISDLLDAVAAKKMSIEVNTSGYVMRNEQFPRRKWLAEAVKRKIPLVAGSDAHRPEEVGRFFDRLNEIELQDL